MRQEGSIAGLVLSLAGLSLAMPPISLFLKSKRQLCLPMGNGALDLVPWAGRGAVRPPPPAKNRGLLSPACLLPKALVLRGGWSVFRPPKPSQQGAGRGLDLGGELGGFLEQLCRCFSATGSDPINPRTLSSVSCIWQTLGPVSQFLEMGEWWWGLG